MENIVSGPDGLAAAEGKPGTVTWTMRSPYVFVGGRHRGGRRGREVLHFGGRQDVADRRRPTWTRVFSTVGPARYEYQLKCQLEGRARLRRLAILNDVQMAPLTMPEMVVGENRFTYSDQSAGERKVRITHRWVERSTSPPPPAPAAAIYPPDGGEANGTDVVFQWTAADGPEGEPAGDYHFELSSRADMRWPLSMDFYKLISRTADVLKEKGKDGGQDKTTVKAQYTLPQPGLLTPDRRYYWRVRAMNEPGRLGAVEPDVEFHGARAGVSVGLSRWITIRRQAWACCAGKPIPSAVGRPDTGFTAATKRASPLATSPTRARWGLRRPRWRRGIPGSRPTSSPKPRATNWR